jgi:hypothetical protein
VRVAGAPVRDVHVVERRLEELVLQHHPLLGAQALVDLREGLGETILAAADVLLARVVRPVGEPDLEVAGSGRVHDVDARQVVVDRLPPDDRVGVRERAGLVVVVLERVRVDRAEGHPLRRGEVAESCVVVHPVPGDVQRDRRGQPGELVHRRRIRDLLLDGARRARRREDLEARAGVAERPGGQLDGLLLELAEDVGAEVGHGGVLVCDDGGRQPMNRFIGSSATVVRRSTDCQRGRHRPPRAASAARPPWHSLGTRGRGTPPVLHPLSRGEEPTCP